MRILDGAAAGRGGAVSFRFVAGALMAASLAVAPAVGQAPSDTASIARELDGIRDQLVALNIESALTAVNAILERPGLADAQRVEALDLRAQAHAASDDLSGVEKDFRAILEIKADYVPRARRHVEKSDGAISSRSRRPWSERSS